MYLKEQRHYPIRTDPSGPDVNVRIVMKRVLLGMASIVMLCTALVSFLAAEEASEPQQPIQPLRMLTCPTDLLRGCRDLYCPKPLPCPTPLCGECGNDYCRKPCPSVRCFGGCRGADCYCRKPCPNLCRPLAADYFTCAEGSDGCAESPPSGPATTLPNARPDVVRSRPKDSR